MVDSAGTVGPRRLRQLLDATAAIASDLDLPVVLRRVVEIGVELVDARYGALGVLDESGGRLAQFITVGIEDATRELIGDLPKGLGLLGSLITSATPLRLADLHAHPDSVGFPPGHPPMISFLGVPIRIGDEVFGNLYLTEKTTGEVFTDIDEELALGLASAAAVAIENARLFGQVRQHEAVLSAMNEIVGALLAGTHPTDSLRLVARHARQLVGADLATIVLPHADGDYLAIEIADGPLGDKMVGRRFVRDGSVSGEVLASGRMIVLDDASSDNRTYRPQLGIGRIGPAAWVALVFDGRQFGILTVARPVGTAPFTPSELDLVRSFAARASLALKQAEVRQYQARLERLEDQERVARNLHDTVIQRLFATGLSLQGGISLSPDRLRERASRAVEDLDVTIRQIRTAIFGLAYPSSDGAPGLRSRVVQLASEASRALGFEPSVRFTGPLDSVVDGSLAEDLLATLREALSNIAHHAAASSAEIDITVDDAVVMLFVRDDGIGIPPAAAATGGRGLDNMRARAEGHGGRLDIEPGTDRGTKLTWQCTLQAGPATQTPTPQLAR